MAIPAPLIAELWLALLELKAELCKRQLVPRARAELQLVLMDVQLALMRHQVLSPQKEIPMLPQGKGFAAQLREIREQTRRKLALLADDAATHYGELHGALDEVSVEIQEVKKLTAEIKGDMAENGNGGPPLDDPLDGSAAASANSGTDSRALGFSNVHPSLRRPAES